MDLNASGELSNPNLSPKLLIHVPAQVDGQVQVISACPDWLLASLAFVTAYK